MYFSGIVLKDTCQERLSKEESGYPIIWRGSLIDPLLHEFEPFNKVDNVAAQGLETWVGHFQEEVRNLIVKEAVEDYLELLTHHHESVDGLVHVDEVAVNRFEQLVEAHEFLLQHRVHGLVVIHGVLLRRELDVEVGRELTEEALGNLADDLLR